MSKAQHGCLSPIPAPVLCWKSVISKGVVWTHPRKVGSVRLHQSNPMASKDLLVQERKIFFLFHFLFVRSVRVLRDIVQRFFLGLKLCLQIFLRLWLAKCPRLRWGGGILVLFIWLLEATISRLVPGLVLPKSNFVWGWLNYPSKLFG